MSKDSGSFLFVAACLANVCLAKSCLESLATVFSFGGLEECIFSNSEGGNVNSGCLHMVELQFYIAYLYFLIFP